MKKNNILFIIITFITTCIFCIVNVFLFNVEEDSKVYDYLYNDLLEDYNDLLKTKDFNDKEYNIVGCKVIERNVYTFFDQIIINKGWKDGIEKDAAVVNNDGLIGLVTEVNKYKSRVTLISDNNLKVSVKVNDSNGIYKNGHIDNIINYDEINVGDLVYTSDLTDTVSGLYIGKVRDISLDNYEIKKIISVDILDLKNLKYVYVIGK